MSKTYITKSEAQTRALGARIGKKLNSQSVFGLEGTLGAGKTQFVKGLAKGLGVRHIIQSPTFVLMRVYPVRSKKMNPTSLQAARYRGGFFTKGGGSADDMFKALHPRSKLRGITGNVIKWLVHVDCYRLSSPQDLLDIGLGDYLVQGESVVVIEWANKVRALLPKAHTTIRITITARDQRRLVVSD